MLLNEDSLTRIESQLSERSGAQRTRINKLEEAITAESAKIDADETAQLATAPAENRRMLRATWDKTRRKKLSDLRRKLVEENASDLDAITGKLTDYEADIDASLALYKSPVQALSRESLGDNKRTEYQTQLQNAGPGELQSMADLALANGDKALAAACLTIADRKRKRYTQFDRAAFADRVCGEAVAKMRHRLESTKLAIRSMRQANRAFETGTSNPVDKISLGLAQKRLQPTDNRDGIGAALRGQT